VSTSQASWLIYPPALADGALTIAAYPIGAKFNDLGKFGIANGSSADNDNASAPKTRQPIVAAGTITGVAYQTQAGDATSQMKIHINGVVQATFTLASVSPLYAGLEAVSVAVAVGGHIEIEYDAGTAPGESTWAFLQVLS